MFMRIVTVTVITFFAFTSAQSQKPTFNHLAIYVADLEKSSAFYQDVIGLDTMTNPFHDNKHVWFDIGERTQLHIIAGLTGTSKHSQDNHFCFRVASVDSFLQKLVKAGIEYHNAQGIKNEMTIRPDGVKQIYFTDPDGYWIEINDAK